jgi:hypothetical protein
MTQHEFNIDNFYLNSFEDFDKKKERIESDGSCLRYWNGKTESKAN